MIKYEIAASTLRSLIDPPYGCRDILIVISELLPVLDRILDLNWPGEKFSELKNHIPDVIKLCSAICNEEAEVPDIWREISDSEPIRITRNPIYAALQILALKSSPSKYRSNLMAHCIVANYRGIVSPDSDGHRPLPHTNVDSAFRALRHLDRSALENDTFLQSDAKELYWAIDKLTDDRDSPLSDRQKNKIRAIELCVGMSLGLKEPVLRRSHSTNNTGTYQLIPWTDESNGGEVGGHSFSTRSTYATDRHKEKLIKNAELAGLPREDAAQPATEIKEHGRANLSMGKTHRHSAYKKRGIGQQIRRQAQGLSGQWDRLSEYECWALLTNLMEHPQNRADAQVQLALWLMLSTGRPIEAVANTRLFIDSNKMPHNISTDSLGICYENRQWQAAVPQPDRIRQIRSDWDKNLITTESQVRLPIPDPVWKKLNQFAGLGASKWRGYLFPKNEASELHESVRDYLQRHRARFNSRLTEKRLQRVLFNNISDHDGDVIEAVLITGISLPEGQTTGLSYYCVTETKLQECYKNAMLKLPETDSIDQWFTQDKPAHSIKTRYIGSPYCPKKDRLPLLVQELKKNFYHCKKRTLGADTLRDIHNAYTAYVGFMLMFATGYRSVHMPFSRSTDVDDVTDFLVIADKVDDSMSHSRVVPVPPVLKKQLSLYSEHRKSILHTLYSMTRAPEIPHELFFLDSSSKPTSIENISSPVQHIFNLPLNCNRHYLRSELRSRGVAAEIVDAYMGHWSDGQQPIGRHSTLSPSDYLDELMPALVSILNDMGWKAIRGWA